MTGTSSSGLGREVKVSNFRLSPCDVLVNINDRRDPVSSFKRWAMESPYEHIFVNLGLIGLYPAHVPSLSSVVYRIPMLFESDGNGVIIEPLARRYGQLAVVLRLKSEFDRRRIPCVIEEAVKLAQDPQAQYDYRCIVEYVLPRLLCQRLGLPIPLKYHRDQLMICSEAVFEIFYRAKLVDILRSNCVPPMPGDFVTNSPLLEKVWAGRLSEEIV